MTLTTRYDMGQSVRIVDIDQPGRISKIIVDGKNLFYEVSYWWEGQLKFVSLDEEELKGTEAANSHDDIVQGKQLKRWKI